MSKPKMVIISDSIRRDLHAPLKYFKKTHIVHLWRQANYHDMTKVDFDAVENYQFDSGKELGRLLAELKPDLIQGLESFAGRRALLLSYVVWRYSRKTGTRYLFPSMENLPITQKHGLLWGSVINWWTGLYGRGATRVLYVNEAAHQNLLKAGVPEQKMERKLWGNWGIDTGEFSSVKSKVKSKNEKDQVILFVGKISEAKGVPWLIEAMDEVIKQFPKAQLWLAGPIEKNSQLANSLTHEYINNLGIVKNKDMPDLMRKATIVAAPSITTKNWAEQVGNVSLQALSCGVPVVTTNSGAIPEFVKDGQGAMLVPEKDSKALATAISGLLGNDKMRVEMSQLGRKWILARYDVRKNIEKLDNWVVNLIG